VGRGNAADALDRGPELTVVAIDDDQGRRRRSGEGRWSEQEKLSEMEVCKCKGEC
jgi:hypothetical protein